MAKETKMFTGFEAEILVQKGFKIYWMIFVDDKFPPLTLVVNEDNITEFAQSKGRIYFLLDEPVECHKVNIGTDPTRTKDCDIRMIKPIFEDKVQTTS